MPQLLAGCSAIITISVINLQSWISNSAATKLSCNIIFKFGFFLFVSRYSSSPSHPTQFPELNKYVRTVIVGTILYPRRLEKLLPALKMVSPIASTSMAILRKYIKINFIFFSIDYNHVLLSFPVK
jgi:hypothetical protein